MTLAILLLHALTGMLFILAAGFVFVDTLNASAANLERIRTMSRLVAGLLWLTYFIGGYWYVVNYAPEKAFIMKGPWKFSHSFFMETKEHVFLALLLLGTLLPIIATNDLVTSKGARKLMLWVTTLLVLVGFGMDGAGAIISLGAKVALLPVAGG
ncbi:MAG: hypothetical protein CVU73_10380 [Deltaproteobacteria bacterium HGW-Deltaproteobacteria-8]|jgi:hypothetical protein|nr:MAG: hypothetical protein CVU73_10380 [Deltaproteobacteria bacterium HGW-Deltaproteobacteria-8]